MSQEKVMLKATAWSTFADIISRLLGAIYIIPWFIFMGKFGTQANALFNMGYNIYAYFLLVSTAGINVAIAKQISKYSSQNDETTLILLIQNILRFMILIGIIFSLIMYLFSPFLSYISGGNKNLIPIMRSLSLSVLVFPTMSVLRGIFQGFSNLKPTAISQIIEQLVRIVWMILSTYLIMQFGSKNYIDAVTQSTFAAFIGMLFSCLILFYYLWKGDLFYKIFGSLFYVKEIYSAKDSIKHILETLRESIPFVITGSAIQLFQLIDQWTYISLMHCFFGINKDELLVQFGYLSANPMKIMMIIISIASSIGGIGIALITQNFVKNDKIANSKLIINNLELMFLIVLPSLLGSIVLADSIYQLFYGINSQNAIKIFIFVIFETFPICLYVVLAPILQSLYENKKTMFYFFIGLSTKILLQVPSIYLFKENGPIITSILALTISCYFMFRRILLVTELDIKTLKKRLFYVLFYSIIITLILYLINSYLKIYLPLDNRLNSILHILICCTIAFILYFKPYKNIVISKIK